MWLVGHWQVDNRSTTQPAYQQVADRRGQWGTPVSVLISGGQQPGQKFWTGSQATIRFIDLPTPSEARHIPHHGQGIAVCWVDEDNPENTVAPFCGYVTNVRRVQHPSPTGTPWQALEVEAEDWFGYWCQNYPDNDPGQPGDAWGVMQRRVSRHFARLQAVRLGRFEDTRICGPCFEEGYAGGDNIREANLATGTETFQRHGKQIGQEPYPTDGTTVTGWWVRTPQIVIRRRTGEPQGDDTIGGSTTADQEIVAFSNIIREPGGIEVVAASVSTSVPKIPAFTPPRISQQTVAEPRILHYVELTPGDAAGKPDNPPVIATQQAADGWRQDKFPRTARLSRNDDAHRAALQIAANRFVQGQTSHFDAIEVTVENLEPDEIEQWSKLGFGDEIILNRYRDGVGLQRCMIRGIDWDINIGNATNITVSATPHISPPPVARWAADMIWRDRAFSSGYDFGPPRLGSLTPDHFDTTDGTEVRIRAILRRNDSGRVTVETETPAQQDLIEGWWLQLQLPNGNVKRIQIGSTSSQVWTSTGEEITAAETPDDGDTVRVGLFEQFPTSVIPAADVTVPDVIGLSQSAAEDAIRFAGLVPVGTEVTATSEADDDRTLTQFPSGGTTTSRGATVAFTYGSYMDVTQVAVPNVGNDTEADARATLVGAGLVVGTVTDENETSGADDRVIRTVPAAGTIVGVGSTVNIVLRNLVTTTRTVPNTEGFTEAAARTALTNAGFTVGTVTNEDVTTGVDDTVLRTVPAEGSSVAEGSTVNIVLRNLQAVVPNLDGQTEAQARTALVALGFVVGTVSDENVTTGDDDTVIRTSPAAGSQINVGSTVSLVLRNLQVIVPDVAGQTDAAARTAITAANLTPGTTTDENQIAGTDDRVIRTDPPAGSQVDDGTTVNIVLRNLQAIVPDLTGDTVTEAMAALTAVGLVLDTVFGTDVNTLVQGNDDRVHSQSVAAGSQVDDGTVVRVTLWNYNGALVPNLVGLTRTAALAALTAVGLTGTATPVDTLVEDDDENVLSQTLPAGLTVQQGSAVGFSYYNYVGALVPDLAGLTQTQVQATLTAVGLVGTRADDINVSDAAQNGLVQAQNPAAGTLVIQGSTVSYQLGNAAVLISRARITVGVSGTTAGWRESVSLGSVDPDPWTFVWDNNGEETIQPDRLTITSAGQGSFSVTGNTQADHIEDDGLYLKLILPGASQAPVEGLGAVDNNTWTFSVPVADVPASGEIMVAEIWDGEPSSVNAAFQSTVPDLSGLQEAAARTAVERAFLVPSVSIQNQLSGTDGEVVFQSPAAGALVTPFTTVSVTVRNLQALVPNTAGLTETAARTSLTNAGFVIGTVTDENETSGDDDRVIRTSPAAGQQIDHGSTVNIVLRNLQAAVPDTAGQTETAARAALTNAGFVVGTVTDEDDNFGTDDRVIRTSPAAGAQVDDGSTVNIVLRNLVPAAFWNAILTVGSDGDWSGYYSADYPPTPTEPGSGALSDDDFEILGTDIMIWRLEWDTTNDRIAIWADDAAEATALMVGWFRIEFTGTTAGDLLLDASQSTRNLNALRFSNVLPDNITFPADGTQIAVSWWSAQPVNPARTAGYPIPPDAPQVTVPDINGLTQTAAEAAITTAGLTVGTVGNTDTTFGSQVGLVQTQSPSAGTEVASGSAVDFTLGVWVAMWTATIDWGSGTGASGYSRGGSYGSIDDDMFTEGGVTVRVDDIIRRDNGTIRFTVGSAAQMDEVEGHYLKMALPSGDLWMALPATTLGHTDTIRLIPDANVPADGTDVDVELWRALPEGVTLTPVAGPEQVAVPDVIGDTVAEAQTAIQNAGLVTSATFGTDVNTLIQGDDNLVHSTTPVVGSLVNPGSTVTLTLWNYHGVSVPALVGLSVAQATSALTALNLAIGTAGTEIDVTDEDHNDVIRAQDPAANEIVAPDTAVNYQLGRLVVPDLDGLTQTQAETALSTAGLVGTATDVTTPTQSLDNTVVTDSQSPAAGTAVQPGDAVTYELYDYEATTTDPVKLWSTTLTWGRHPTSSIDRQGYSDADGDSEAYGSLADTTISGTGIDTEVTIERFAELFGDNEGRVRLDVGNATQMDALEGKWFRLELTDSNDDDAIFQIPDGSEAPTGSEYNTPTAVIGVGLAEGSQFALSLWDADPTGQDRTENLPVIPSALWNGTLVWGASPGSDPREGFSVGTLDSSGEYGALTNNGATIGGTAVTFSGIRRLGAEDAAGTIRIDVSSNAAGDALQGKYLRLELEGDMLNGVIFPIQDEIGTSATSGVIIDDTELDSIGFGTQIAVNIWEHNPTNQPRQNTALPLKLPTGALAAAAIQVGREGSWYGWWTGEGLLEPDHDRAYGTAVPSTGHLPWQFNYGTPSELVTIARAGLNANRRARLWVVEAADATALQADADGAVWVRFDLPGVTDPAIAVIPANIAGNPATRFNLRDGLTNPSPNILAQGSDRPDEGEVFMVSLWPTEAAARAG